MRRARVPDGGTGVTSARSTATSQKDDRSVGAASDDDLNARRLGSVAVVAAQGSLLCACRR